METSSHVFWIGLVRVVWISPGRRTKCRLKLGKSSKLVALFSFLSGTFPSMRGEDAADPTWRRDLIYLFIFLLSPIQGYVLWWWQGGSPSKEFVLTEVLDVVRVSVSAGRAAVYLAHSGEETLLLFPHDSCAPQCFCSRFSMRPV